MEVKVKGIQNYSDADQLRQDIQEEFEYGDLTGYWVYVLKCSDTSRHQLKETHKLKVGKNLEKVPSWAWKALHEDKKLYVGATDDLIARLFEHLNGYTYRSYGGKNQAFYNESKFTMYFPPTDLVALERFKDRNKAFRMEKEKSKKLRKEGAGFVFQA